MTKSKLESLIPKEFPSYLEGDFGRAFLQEYNRLSKEKYGNPKVRGKFGKPIFDVLEEKDGIIVGGNCFSTVLANEILRPLRLKTADFTCVEDYMKMPKTKLEWERISGGVEVYAGLFIAGGYGCYNLHLEYDLIDQIKEKTKEDSVEKPLMINLSDLELKQESEGDYESPYGLFFKLRDDAEIIRNNFFNTEVVHFYPQDVDDKGLPTALTTQGMGKTLRTLVGARYDWNLNKAGLRGVVFNRWGVINTYRPNGLGQNVFLSETNSLMLITKDDKQKD